ncbi:General stress protein 69 [Rubripirellula lacrimiformis]|uniref:General stress protein 69 n=1 Tax=Rubripirellula lacrimiformis TaxID=1930273 RepID=A0A517NFN9_9BACT|nr:aldo/keto reductase [Rubripirellula lacrimiformis]QDT05952.1 General stress protein 69 [Rubripirellula lacrimiformis]
MHTRSLGIDGPLVSEIGFGAWAIGGGWGEHDDRASIEAVHKAIDNGVNFIDTAAGYGDGHSERLIAQVMKERSEDIVVATKTPPADGPWPPSPYCRWQDRYSAAYLRDNIHTRLTNLGTDRLDLLQLHTWTRAWNDDPQPLLVLRQMREEGKIGLIGVSTPEQDQSCVIQLMRDGLVDVVQIIFNLFDQEPAAQILPVAAETGTGVIVRVALDEGALAGKYPADHVFPENDFRHRYFAGDRMARTVQRVEQIQSDMKIFGIQEQYTPADVALKFVLARPEVSTVIAGMRNVQQVEQNTRTSRLKDLPEDLLLQLRRHHWHRGIWYGGKD